MSGQLEHREQLAARVDELDRDGLLRLLESALIALRVARPYVAGRVIPPGHPGRDWRAETAEESLVTVDEALRAIVSAHTALWDAAGV